MSELERSQLPFVSSESYQKGEAEMKWVTHLLVNVVYPVRKGRTENERAVTTGAEAPLPKRKGRRVLRVVT